MDASHKIQRGIHVHLIQFLMCPEFWVHIKVSMIRFFTGKNPVYHTWQRKALFGELVSVLRDHNENAGSFHRY